MKRSLITFSLLSLVSLPALAGNTAFFCEQPVLEPTQPATAPVTQFVLECASADALALAPSVRFAGELSTRGEPPYLVKGQYTVATDGLRLEVTEPTGQQATIAVGELAMASASLADLSAEVAQRIVWDGNHRVLSVESLPGQWQAFSVSFDEAGQPQLVRAGLVSAPVVDGISYKMVPLNQEVSRFSREGLAPVIAYVGLADGVLNMQVDESREANAALLAEALRALDRQPKDISRAWAAASLARFLGEAGKVRYVEQKVAAAHPELLDEFQADLARITPLQLSLQGA